MNLTERKILILTEIITEYIRSGEPVGSKALCEIFDYSVSSATIRNDMAELSEMGLLTQPHTSAGRIPSETAMRFYIDNLMPNLGLPNYQINLLDNILNQINLDPEALIETASANLSDITQMVSISTTPISNDIIIAKIELMSAGKNKSLIFIITSNGLIKKNLFNNSIKLSDFILDLFYDIAKKYIIGRPISEINLAFIQTIASKLNEHAFVITPLLIALYETIKDSSTSKLKLHGQVYLLMNPNLDGNNALKIMSYLSDKNDFLNLLNNTAHEIHVFIGSECCSDELKDSSIVAAKYKIGNQNAGIIGLIGSIRMDYPKILPSLKYFADKLGNLLSDND